MLNLKHLEPDKIILIGASTGGPGHINKILAALKPEFNATIIIAQHMGNDYIPSFIKQLNSVCYHDVSPVVSQKVLLPSHIYVCSLLTSINIHSEGLTFLQNNYTESDYNYDVNYNPDIDYLYRSAAKIARQVSFLGIILTGIGSDGANGCKSLSEMGGECIAESETSAIVDGMPRQARKIVPNIEILPLNEIIIKINQFGRAHV